MSDKEINKQSLLKSGLIQYVGAMLENSDFSPREASQLAVANLVETAVEIAKKEEKLDYYIAKPILRAAVYVISSRKKELDEALKHDLIAEKEYKKIAESNNFLVEELEKIIGGLKK